MNVIRRLLRIDKPMERALAQATTEEIQRTRAGLEDKLKVIEAQQREQKMMKSRNALRVLDQWGGAHNILRGMDQ